MNSWISGCSGECYSTTRDLGNDQEIHDRPHSHLGQAVSVYLPHFWRHTTEFAVCLN